MTEYYAEKKYTTFRFENYCDIIESDICAAVYLGDLSKAELSVWKQHVEECLQIEEPENWTLEYRSPKFEYPPYISEHRLPEWMVHHVVLLPKHTIDAADLNVRSWFQRRLNLYSDPTFRSQFPDLIDDLKLCECCANDIHAASKAVPPDAAQTVKCPRKSLLTVNERLIIFLHKNRDYSGSAVSLANLMGCSHTAIDKSPAWEGFKRIRESEKRERAEKHKDVAEHE